MGASTRYLLFLIDAAKGLEDWGKSEDNLRMTVTADDRRRVLLPVAKPGDRFDAQVWPDGKVVLTPLVPEGANARMVEPVMRDGLLMLPVEPEQVDWDALICELRKEREETNARLLG
jgi:hypothetical protein